jgi:hypothetical protein
MDEGGNYICTAENMLGRVSAPAQITVIPALKFTLKLPIRSLYDVGDRITLDCQADNAIEIVWMKDNKQVGISATVYSNGTLVIPRFTRKDSGIYVCIAKNSQRSIKTMTNVQVRPSKSCSELKKKIPNTPSGNYVIDPDGQSGQTAFSVFCDMTDRGGVGVTIVSHDSEKTTPVNGAAHSAGSYRRDVRYNGVNMSQLALLTNVSSNCEQFIKFECEGDVKFINSGFAWWASRDNVPQHYWGGAKPGGWNCACDLTNSCKTIYSGCNCNNKPGGWRSDSGLLTDKSTLPVTQLRFGDTDEVHERGYHTLGKLKCYG